MKDLQYIVLGFAIVLMGLLIDEKLDEMRVRKERMIASAKEAHREAELFIASEPWGTWTAVTPEGNEVHVILYGAIKEGKPLWVVRRNGVYLDGEFEYTTDRILSFDRGLSFIAEQDTAKRNGKHVLVE